MKCINFEFDMTFTRNQKFLLDSCVEKNALNRFYTHKTKYSAKKY